MSPKEYMTDHLDDCPDMGGLGRAPRDLVRTYLEGVELDSLAEAYQDGTQNMLFTWLERVAVEVVKENA